MISPTDELLPWSQEAEEAVIGSLLIDPSATAIVSTLVQPQDFHDTRLGDIFRACIHLGQSLDFVTLNEHLKRKDWQPLLASVIGNVPTAMHVEHYASIVHSDGVRRRIIKFAGDIAQKAHGTEDADDVVSYVQSLATALSEGHSAGDQSVTSLVGAFYDTVEERFNNPLGLGECRYLSTGFPAIDEITDGLAPRTLTIVCARPSIGKSGLAMEMARRVGGGGHNVLIFSLEMSWQQILERWASAMSGLDMKMAQRGHGDTAAYLDAVVRLSGRHNIWIDDTPALTPEQVRARALARHLQNPLDLIVLDHGGIMSPSSKMRHNDNKSSAEGYKTQAMKDIAREIGCAFLLVLQLNRGLEGRANKRPIMADLRDCLTADTKVIDVDTGAPTTLDELVPGRRILAYKRDTYDIVPAIVTDVLPKGHQEVFEVTTRLGRRIKATSNHPFMTEHGWKKLGELRVGDKVVTAERLTVEEPPYPIDPELSRLLGYMVGNGSCRRLQTVSFTSMDQEVLDDIKRIVAKNFPNITIRTKKKYRKTKATTLEFVQIYENGYGKPGGNSMIQWLKNVGIYGHGAYTKRTADAIFTSGNKGVAEYLGGYFATDGCITSVVRKGKRGWSIRFDTCSPQLAEDVQLLLLRFGILSSISVDSKIRELHYYPMHRIAVNGRRDQLLLFAQQIPVVGVKAKRIAKMVDAIDGIQTKDMFPLPNFASLHATEITNKEWRNAHRGIGKPAALRYAVKYQDSELYNLATADVIWEPIVSIVHAGIEETWDICVPGTGCFIANGFAVHNSGEHEQIGDVILGLYREEAYDPGTPNKDIMEVGVLKNRQGPADVQPIMLHYEKSTQRFRDTVVTRKKFEEML